MRVELEDRILKKEALADKGNSCWPFSEAGKDGNSADALLGHPTTEYIVRVVGKFGGHEILAYCFEKFM